MKDQYDIKTVDMFEKVKPIRILRDKVYVEFIQEGYLVKYPGGDEFFNDCLKAYNRCFDKRRELYLAGVRDDR